MGSHANRADDDKGRSHARIAELDIADAFASSTAAGEAAM
jgi:hypothetical protein